MSEIGVVVEIYRAMKRDELMGVAAMMTHVTATVMAEVATQLEDDREWLWFTYLADNSFDLLGMRAKLGLGAGSGYKEMRAAFFARLDALEDEVRVL